MTAAPAATRSRRRPRETTRAAALTLAFLASIAAPSRAAARAAWGGAGDAAFSSPGPASAAAAGDVERARSMTTGGVGMMGASALLGALAVWQWAWSDSYVDFMLGDDPGPLIDPTVFFTPGESIVLAGLGGERVLRGISLHRGLAAEVPWTYWLPLVPAAAALGAETFLFFHEPPSPTADKIIAFGTASAVLGFWISTAWHAARIPEGTESAKAAPSATAPVIVPRIGFRAGSPSVGIALSGDF